jgi:hypothetical protein
VFNFVHVPEDFAFEHATLNIRIHILSVTLHYALRGSFSSHHFPPLLVEPLPYGKSDRAMDWEKLSFQSQCFYQCSIRSWTPL